MSVVAPGSAQYVAGSRRLGRTTVQIWAGLVVVCGVVLWLVPLDELAGLFVRPWLLTTVQLLLFAVAVAWVALLVDAWRLGHPPGLKRKHRLVMVGTTLALSALVATPLLLAARYASAAHEAVVALFPSREAAATSDGRLNVLLLGADAGEGRVGVRPDSITLVSVDVRTGTPLLVSVPRNLEKARFAENSAAAAQFPNGFSGEGDRGEWLINATWTYGEDNPELFPGEAGPGVTAVKQAVEGTLGLSIHYFVVIDLDGFSNLVDALGGVTIRITEPIPIGSDGEVLEPGLRRLDGHETLWYARSRTDSSDYARMSRQRCVLGAILHEADPSTVLRNFTALAEASTSVITTDIPQAELPELIDMAWRAKDIPITSLQLVPPLIEPADPDLGVIAEQLDLAMEVSVGAGSDDADTEVTAAPTAMAGPQLAASPADERSDADPATEDEAADAPPVVDLSSVCSYE
jgi:LCP family protein required for cell wall assembly